MNTPELPLNASPGAMLTEEQVARFDREIDGLLPHYPPDRKQAAMLPALHLMQSMVGYLTPEALLLVAKKLGVSPEKTAEVATFYSMFHLVPAGRHRLEVCTNLSCSLRGAEQVVERLENKLGISLGETTSDGRISLTEVECLASCGTAPCLQLDQVFYENLTPESVDALVAELRPEGSSPSHTGDRS